MPGPLLYSTNTFLKLLIQERYRGDKHYVWCSESFDSAVLSRHTAGHLVAPSSNPREIYAALSADVRNNDRHSSKIKEQKLSLTTLAVNWEAAGEINPQQKEDLIYLIENASFNEWRPLIYVIPRGLVIARAVEVPAAKRASIGVEYIISDLARNEFDTIEVPM